MGFYLTEQLNDTANERRSAEARQFHPGATPPIGAPFGTTILSTKYWDEDSKLSYYGYRYFSPGLGRWVTHDPYEEKGSLNLYLFNMNSSVANIDTLGLEPFEEATVLNPYVEPIRPAKGYNFSHWLKESLPGEGEPCDVCDQPSIKIERKDDPPTGFIWKTFHFRSKITHNDGIRNIEYFYETCLRFEIGADDWTWGGIPKSWMQQNYDLSIYWLKLGPKWHPSMQSGFYVKYQICELGYWKTVSDVDSGSGGVYQ